MVHEKSSFFNSKRNPLITYFVTHKNQLDFFFNIGRIKRRIIVGWGKARGNGDFVANICRRSCCILNNSRMIMVMIIVIIMEKKFHKILHARQQMYVSWSSKMFLLLPVFARFDVEMEKWKENGSLLFFLHHFMALLLLITWL